MKHRIKTLPNGLRLLVAPMSGTETATILVMAATGSRNETKENNGISHFLEHMFFKGTKKRPTTMKLSGELDELGGVYNAFTSKEFTGYWAKADSKRINKAIDIIADMLMNSKFSAVEIEREKGVIIEELNMYRDNPMIYIEDVFEGLLYGDQPAGWEIIGPKENIQSFQRKDFLDYVRTQYGAGNLIVCLAGKVSAQAEKSAETIFSQIKEAKHRPAAQTEDKQTAPQIVIHQKKTDQAHLSLGVKTFGAGHKDEITLKMLAAILGGSMSSRLFISLRERKGLAYYVKTFTELSADSGYLTTQAGVPTGKTQEAAAIIMKEYSRILRETVSAAELRRVKDMIRGRLIIQMESSDSLANWYGRMAVMKEKLISPEKYLQAVDKVSASDIKKCAREVFQTNKLNLALICPDKDQAVFGKVLTF